MPLASATYEGWVTHRRHRPCEHAFRYRLGLLYVDLDELPDVLDVHPLWSARRFAPAWFRREDYLAPSKRRLSDAVRAEIGRRTGTTPTGPVRLLTHPRYWGMCFNPVSFYYVFTDHGEDLQCVLADVTNTPWRERHAYLLGPLREPDTNGLYRPISRKVFHVSPFMQMDMEYRWQLLAPSERLLVSIENHDAEGKLFDATLSLARRELERRSLGRLLWQYPLQSVKVVAGIHWEALRLWGKRVPFVPHPGHVKEEER
jgi:DUF1365 family protein